MKRTSLLFGILLFAAGTFAQSGVTNKEFVTDGNLAASTIDPTVQTASWAGKGVWASRFGSWKDATISVVADTERGHAIKASYTKTNNDYDNGPYIYQRLKDQPGGRQGYGRFLGQVSCGKRCCWSQPAFVAIWNV